MFSSGPCWWNTTAFIRLALGSFRRDRQDYAVAAAALPREMRIRRRHKEVVLTDRFRRRLLPRDPSPDEALRQVSARHVEMPEHAAELAGGVEPRDRSAEDVENALALVVARTTLRVRHDGPELRYIERRL